MVKVTADMSLGLKEDISDILTPEGIKSGQFTKGQLLKFNCDGTLTYIKITHINVKNGKATGLHIQPVKTVNVTSHYGHNVDSTRSAIHEWGCPYCTDCEMPVSSQAKPTIDNDNTLNDGTIIGDGTEIDNDN